MMENYGLYPNQRGINTINVAYKNTNYERGGPYYPNSLREVRGVGAELSYSNYCQNLANAGCNLLRVKWSGINKSSDGGWCALEPPPYGTYNIWQSVLDPSDIATYRSDQVTYPVGAAAWNASNLKEFIEQCAAYNIHVLVLIFETSEFDGNWWNYHAWKQTNRYINGQLCAAADQGFIENAYDLFTDATAIQAAKDRIDFLVDVLGTNKAVVAWELWAEMTWILRPAWWGEASWNAAMRSNIRDKVNPWVTLIGNYLRAADPYNRPIGMGVIVPKRTAGQYVDWPADPDDVANLKNDPMIQYPVDLCVMNLYDDSFAVCVEKFRLAKQKAGDKLLWVTQHSPVQMDERPREEVSPFLESLKRQWINVCGERWGLGSIRWPGLYDPGSGWQTGGYADSDLYGIPGVTEAFADNVAWNTWKTNNYVFDDYVVASGTSNFLSYGDGRNVTFHTEFSSGGTKSIQIEHLESGTYTFTWYDWTLGSTAGSSVGTATSGTFTASLGVSDLQDNFVVAHLLHN
jgi:hypothetical protein